MRAILSHAVLVLILIHASTAAHAMSGEGSAGSIAVKNAWARPTVGSSKQGVIYLAIRNAGTSPDRLIGASTPAAESAELHTVRTEGGMMKMRAVDAVAIPPGESVDLTPGGDHIMLINLVRALQSGEEIALTLTFEIAGDLELSVPIRDGAPEAMSH